MSHLANVHESLNGIIPDEVALTLQPKTRPNFLNPHQKVNPMSSSSNVYKKTTSPTSRSKNSKTTKVGFLKCPICNTAKSAQNLNRHIGTKHYLEELHKYFGKSSLECGLCPKKFSAKQLTASHVLSKHKVLEKICPTAQIPPIGECLKKEVKNEVVIKSPIVSIKRLKKLDLKTKNKKPRSVGSAFKYQCHKCPNQYMGYFKLMQHLCLSHFYKELVFKYSNIDNQCHLCEKKFNSQNGMLSHLASFHEVLKSSIPPKSSLAITNEDPIGDEMIEEEMETGKDSSEEPMEEDEALKDLKTEEEENFKTKKCFKCSKTFPVYAALLQHYCQSHFGRALREKFGNVENKCKFCPKKFSHQNGLNYHLAGTHNVLEKMISKIKN
jgi:hypothetical protein